MRNFKIGFKMRQLVKLKPGVYVITFTTNLLLMNDFIKLNTKKATVKKVMLVDRQKLVIKNKLGWEYWE